MTIGQNASPEGTRNLSEALKHLRFVHFTLVVGAIALFITQSQETSTRTERAHDDSVKMLSITDRWDELSPVSLFLRRLHSFDPTYDIDALVGEYVIRTDSFALSDTNDNEIEPYYIVTLGADQVFQLSRDQNGRIPQNLGASGWSLAGFRRAWDEIEGDFDLSVILKIEESATISIDRNGDVVKAQADMTKFVTYPKGLVKAGLEGYFPGTALQNVNRIQPPHRGRFARTEEWKSEDDSTHYLIATMGGELAIQATIHVGTVIKERINPQEEIIASIEASWRTGSFSETFRDIDSLSQNLGSIALSDLEKHLYALRQQEGERLSIIGLEIPANVIHRYGPILLLILQCYFVLHYRKFAPLLVTYDQATDFPWIGVYDDRPSRIVFIVTAAVLPTIVSTYVIWKGISREEWPFQMLLIACAGGQIVASIATSLIVRRTWINPVAARNIDPGGT